MRLNGSISLVRVFFLLRHLLGTMDPERVAVGLLRQAFAVLERCLDPVVRGWAQQHWGTAAPTTPGALPKWLWQCQALFSFAMKEPVKTLPEWDAYILGTIIIDNLSHILPSHLRGNDAESEVYR